MLDSVVHRRLRSGSRRGQRPGVVSSLAVEADLHDGRLASVRCRACACRDGCSRCGTDSRGFARRRPAISSTSPAVAAERRSSVRRQCHRAGPSAATTGAGRPASTPTRMGAGRIEFERRRDVRARRRSARLRGRRLSRPRSPRPRRPDGEQDRIPVAPGATRWSCGPGRPEPDETNSSVTRSFAALRTRVVGSRAAAPRRPPHVHRIAPARRQDPSPRAEPIGVLVSAHPL